jgi:Tfp pilus assembly protein PilF
MRLFVAGFLSIAIFCGHAAAQALPEKVDLRGQVFMPRGEPAQGNIRIQLTGESGQRPPEYFYTDSKGSFVVNGLKQGFDYTLVIEADPKGWATTTEKFHVMGDYPFVTIHLRPPVSTETFYMPSVSAYELKENVTPAARRQYQFAVEQLVAGDLERARRGFEKAIALFPNFVEARSELAVIHMRQRDLAGAETLLRRALEFDPVAARPLFNLGLCLYRQQRIADALPVLERGVQLQPINAHGNLLYGITLFVSGDDARAEPFLRKAYEQGGKRVAKAQLYLSRVYTQQKKYGLAAQALEIYLRDAPDAPNLAELQTTLDKLRAAARP